jgi:polyhydroxybutyrate depolymerase
MNRRAVLLLVVGALALPVVLALVGAARYRSSNAPNGRMISSGIEREYVVHVPESYDPSRKTPLVISLHGAGLWGAGQRDISGWNTVADSAGFIVAYPSGSKPGLRVWRSMSPANMQIDVRFISDLIDTLQAHYNIDPGRVFANGLSNGGGMSWALACTTSHRVAAVGLVGAALFLPFDWCPDTTAVPAVVFHGTDDRQARYRGGTSWVARDPFQPIPSFVASWARHNGCSPAPLETRVAPDVARKAYVNCAQGADVVLYTIEGGGHTWPGGPDVIPEWFAGRTTRGIDASRVMWDFFQAHPRAGQ